MGAARREAASRQLVDEDEQRLHLLRLIDAALLARSPKRAQPMLQRRVWAQPSQFVEEVEGRMPQGAFYGLGDVAEHVQAPKR